MIKILRIFIVSFMFIASINGVEAALLQDKVVEYREKGFEAQRKGDLNKALKYYQKVIQIDPYHAVTYNDLGVLYETKGQLKLAKEAYLEAIQVDSTFPASYYNLGCLYESMESYAKAMEYFQRRMELGDSSSRWFQKAKDKLTSIQDIINPPAEEKVEDIAKEEVVEEAVVEVEDIVGEDISKQLEEDLIIEKELTNQEISLLSKQLEEQKIREEKLAKQVSELQEEFLKESADKIASKEAMIKQVTIEEEEPEIEVSKKPAESSVPLYAERETEDPHLERAKRAYREKDYFTAVIEANKSRQLDRFNSEAEELLRKAQRKFLVE